MSPLPKIKLLILLVFFSIPVWGQELPPPEEENGDTRNAQSVSQSETDTTDSSTGPEVTADDFLDDSSLPYTGTLDPEDEDNMEEQVDRELFGEEEETLEEKILGETHLLKLRFVSHLQLINVGEPSPYLEVEYTNSIETPVTMNRSRFSAKVPMTFDVQKWGYLAQNELFACDLDVSMQEVPVEITTRVIKTPAQADD